MAETGHSEETHSHGEGIHLPAPTAWPIILAFGITMAAAGLLTNYDFSLFGLVFVVAACIGWFRQVLPHEQHEEVPIEDRPVVIASSRALVERIRLSPEHRAAFPIETYPIKSGLKGGIAGGIAMIFPALLYGLIAHGSIWYPVNLLGGAGVANWRNPTDAQIAAFHWEGLLVATAIHISTCLLVGLIYGAMLPMLPRHPIVLGGVVGPMFWTGLLYSFLGFINPSLNAHISWPWFIVSQITFGIVAGLVVTRHQKIRTDRHVPLAALLGMEMPGLIHSRPDVGPPQSKKEKH